MVQCVHIKHKKPYRHIDQKPDHRKVIYMIKLMHMWAPNVTYIMKTQYVKTPFGTHQLEGQHKYTIYGHKWTATPDHTTTTMKYFSWSKYENYQEQPTQNNTSDGANSNTTTKKPTN